ncbi:hypothetical protein NDU88_003717 [Pleurodeles waltl]|uniref:Uncharacterized protein n=1 Tax=Pleurodeles waltl TaxID=8319 RepID=A0AAV7UZR5_PLEWA|nr:hypothetical protein NDU88_003717 [Pleurodeles waltl]
MFCAINATRQAHSVPTVVGKGRLYYDPWALWRDIRLPVGKVIHRRAGRWTARPPSPRAQSQAGAALNIMPRYHANTAPSEPRLSSLDLISAASNWLWFPRGLRCKVSDILRGIALPFGTLI